MKYLYILLFFLIAMQTSVAQFTLSNEKMIGGVLDDNLSFKHVVGNSIFYFGNSNSPASGNKSDDSFGQFDIWVVKTDINNNILWDTIYGGIENEILWDTHLLTDGFLLISESRSDVSGNKSVASNGDSDIWVFKISFDGVKTSEFSYGGNGFDRPWSSLLSSGQLYILGASSSDISGNKTVINYGFSDYWLLEIDQNNGTITNQKVFGTSNSEGDFGTIIKTADSTFLLALQALGNDGNKTELGFGGSDIWLVEIDENFNITNQKCFGGVAEERVESIYMLNGYFYILSTSFSHVSGNKTASSFSFETGSPNWWMYRDLWVVKLNENYEIEWDNSYGGSWNESTADMFYADYDKLVFSVVTRSLVNGFGNKTSPNYGEEDLWVFITDLNGNILTQESFGGANEDYGRVILGNTPTELTIMSTTNSSASSIGNMSVVSNGGFDAWIADVDVQNWLTIAEENASKQIKVYPNPTENNVYFSETVNRVTVANAQGKIVLTTQNKNQLSLENLPTGWYVLEIEHNGKVEQNKLVKN